MGAESILSLAGGLVGLAGQAVAAEEQRAAQVLAEMDQAYRALKEAVIGLRQVLRDNDAAADAAAAALPTATPAPSPLAVLTDEQLRAELARRGATP